MVYLCPLCKHKSYDRGSARAHMTLEHPGIHEEVIHDDQNWKGMAPG